MAKKKTATKKTPATKAAKKKTAKKGLAPTPKRVAKAKDNNATERKSQKTIEGAFPDQDPELERAVTEYLIAGDELTQAKDSKTASYDSLKEKMRKKGLETYFCYGQRLKVKLLPEDAKLKVERVQESEPTPYRAED